MADKLEQDIQRFAKQTATLLNRKLPVAAGKMAKRHFQENFERGGFVDGGLHPWAPAKRLSSSRGSTDDKRKTLMSSRNHLYSSINYTPGMAKVRIFNDVIYAPIHQNGGVLHPIVTPKMRRYAWSRYYSLAGTNRSGSNGRKSGKNGKPVAGAAVESPEAQMWKRLALTKKKKLSITIPARPFMGKSAELDNKMVAYIEKEILRIINS